MTTPAPAPNPYYAQLVETIPKHKFYLIFLSSQERGRPWCRFVLRPLLNAARCRLPKAHDSKNDRPR